MKHKISNRNLSLSFVILVVAFVAISCTTDSSDSYKKPNVVLILTDQQNSNMMSVVGNPQLETPSMDLLARQGVVFTQAYCTSPVCGPSRSSIISGLMPHETGVEWNGQSMKENIINSGEIFRENGYQTVWAGKWHLPESYPQKDTLKQKSIKGFDLLPWKPKLKRWFLGAETDPTLTVSVVEYLENYNNKKPLFLAISYHNPHDICMYPRKAGWITKNDSLLEIRHYGFKYRLPDVIGTSPDKIADLPPLPHNHEIQHNEPDFLSEKRRNHHEYGLETQLASNEFGDLEWQGYLNAYNRLTEMVDVEIGKVVVALKENGYWGNTLIIFSSDHGDGAAAHKWAAKLSLYEESSKIPMIMVWPGHIPAGMIDKTHLVSQIDILPTMLDFAGIKTDLSFTGKSIKTIINDQSVDWRKSLVVELADYKKNPTRKGRMLRLGEYKYNIYSTGEEQLFNLENDPGEMVNLISNSDFNKKRIQCKKSLKQWAIKTNDTFSLNILKY